MKKNKIVLHYKYIMLRMYNKDCFGLRVSITKNRLHEQPRCYLNHIP